MSLKEADWKELLYSIDEPSYPFIGAGACAKWLPLANEISATMAKEYEYPLDDSHELERVSQYVAMEYGDMTPKNFIIRWLKKVQSPNFSEELSKNTPHAILADLNIPIYITTNYDGFMEEDS